MPPHFAVEGPRDQVSLEVPGVGGEREQPTAFELAKQKSPQRTSVGGDKESNGFTENAVMLVRGIIRSIKWHLEQHARATQDESAYLAVVGETCRMHLVQMAKGSWRDNAI